MKQQVLLITLVLLIAVIVVSAQDPSGGGQELQPQEINPEQGLVNVGQYFGFEDMNRVKVRGLGDSDQVIKFEQLEGDRRKVSGPGDFSVTFFDKEGEELKKYSGFQKGEFDNTLVFDKNNELDAGTKIIAGETEEGPGTKIPLGSQKHYIPKGGELLINKAEESKKITITPSDKIDEHNIIKPPEQLPVSSEIEGQETIVEYKANEKTQLIADNKKVDADGSLYYKGNKGGGNFYHKKDSILKIGDVQFFKGENQGDWTLIKTDNNQKLPENYKGSWVVLDQTKGIVGVGTNTIESSPVLNIPEINPYVNLQMKDDFLRVLAIQATSENGEPSEVLITPGKEDDVPILKMMGMGAKVDVDDKHLGIGINPKTDKPDIYLDIKSAKLLSKEIAEKTLTFPMKVEYYKDNKGTPLNDDELDLYVNGFRQFATLPKDTNWQEQNFLYKTKADFSISPRLKYNYLHPDQQKVFNQVIEEKGKTYDFFEESGFFELSPGRQKEFLEQFYPAAEPEPVQEPSDSPPVEPDQPSPEPEPEPDGTQDLKGRYITKGDPKLIRSTTVRVLASDIGNLCPGCGKRHGAISSGTIIGVGKDKEGKKHAIILTAAHVLGKNTAVEIPGNKGKVRAKVLAYQGGGPSGYGIFQRVPGVDVALLMAPIDNDVVMARVAPKGYPIRTGQTVISAGHDCGKQYCRVIKTRISRQGQYTVTYDAPLQGRSGGALYDMNGKIIGVTSMTDHGGYYSRLSTIHGILDQVGLSRLYQLILVFSNIF